MIKMCVYEQILIYMFVELYKNNNKGLTKQNVLELRDKNENKHQGFFLFFASFWTMYCWYVLHIYVIYHISVILTNI